MNCPKCGSENYHETDSIGDSDRRRPTKDYLYCYDCGHEEKVKQ
jgi:sarcosine oxidase delta subunit